VLFLFESLPGHLQAVLWFNPLVHVIGLTRAGLYPAYDAAGAAPVYVLLLLLALLAAGGLAFRRAERFLARLSGVGHGRRARDDPDGHTKRRQVSARATGLNRRSKPRRLVA